MPPSGPLDGLRILDLTRILAGPTCTQLLGDLGADILKIEKPGEGDDTRAWGPPYVTGHDGKPTKESAYYLCANRNKRSVAADIATPDGAALVKRLAGKCDVLIENFKAGGLKKYGLGYDDFKADHPRLVYCSITGYGQTGPTKDKPGYDLLAQGYGGIMSLTGDSEGQPMKVGVGIADVMCGMYASTAILAALRHRDRTGEGQHIDIALVDSQIAWLINEGTNYLMSGQVPKRRGNGHPNIVPYNVFETSDGHAIVAVGNDTQFQRFCTVIGLADLANDPRYTKNTDRLANRETLNAIVAERVKQLPRDTLIAGMEKASVPGGPIHRLDDVFASDQVKAREMHIKMEHPLAKSGTVDLIGNPIKLSKTPVTYRRAPPACGADTDEVIRDVLGSSEKP